MSSELHLIIGPMFSGKTTELLKIAKRLSSINLKVLLINYHEDTRYSSTEMKTHDNDGIPCKFINNLLETEYLEYDIICINEAQFFTNLVKFCKDVLKNNKTIYVSGLDGDYKQEKFGEILDLIPFCDFVLKLKAYCKICQNGTLAPFTKRIIESNEQKLIGTNEYIPVCRKHLI
jgi:thymidine kinase